MSNFVFCDCCGKRIDEGSPAVSATIGDNDKRVVFHNRQELLEYFRVTNIILDEQKHSDLVWYWDGKDDAEGDNN
jgi:hypothetical protein